MATQQAPEPADEILLDQSPRTDQRLFFDGRNLDHRRIHDKTVTHSHFRDTGFKEASFEDCAFNHSRFERCYFRKTSFTQVSFINCTFRDCSFDDAQLTHCQLDYAEFYNCHIGYRQLAHTLPARDNVVLLLARNLRVNAQNRGQTEDLRPLLLLEIAATERHNYRKAFERSDSFYKNKYKGVDRLRGFGTWLRLKLSGAFWGHGEVLHRIFISAAVVIVGFGLAFRGLSGHFANLASDSSIIDYVGVSAAAFVTTTYGNVLATTTLARWLVTIEGGMGFTVFGFFVAALYRRISRR